MATVSPPITHPTESTASPRRKPVPATLEDPAFRRMSAHISDTHKPLPTATRADGALYRDAPVSPVRVNHPTGALPTPSNASIELAPPVPETQVPQLQNAGDPALHETPKVPCGPHDDPTHVEPKDPY